MARTPFWTLVLVAVSIGPSIGGCVGLAGSSSVSGTLSHNVAFTIDSTNWAGYAVVGSAGSVSQVTGSWIQPSVTCTKSATYLGLWDGIDGFNTKTVEQAGTLAYCLHGNAHYSAWYEFYPKASVTIPSLTVTPGSTISVTVTYNASAADFAITVTVGNVSYTHVGTSIHAKLATAECIDERPMVNGHLTHLADFGNVTFGADSTSTIGCGATINGITGSFGNFSSVLAINMIDKSRHVLSSTSSLSTDGSSFTGTWVASS